MGKVRIGKVKGISNELALKYGNVFTTSFDENKKLVQQYTDIGSKRLKNRVAGYITRLKVNEKKRAEMEAAEAEKVAESEPKQTLDIEGEPQEVIEETEGESATPDAGGVPAEEPASEQVQGESTGKDAAS